MYETGSWVIHVTAGGWTRCVSRDGEKTVYLLLRPADHDPAQLSTHASYMESAKPISVHAWSQVPFRGIETAVSLAAMDVVTAEHGCDPAGGFRQYFMDHADKWVRVSYSEHTPHTPQPTEEPPALARPARITDDFLKSVAAKYRWVSAQGELPGPVIAAETGAPVRTAQRWVYEARKRGFLAPGRPGRTG